MAFFERAGTNLPPPCAEVGLLSVHARRRPGGGRGLASWFVRYEMIDVSTAPPTRLAFALSRKRLADLVS